MLRGLHRIGTRGCIIGLLPDGDGDRFVSDVDADVSRRHVRLWQEGGALFAADLNSTNGTSVIRGTSGERICIAPPISQRGENFVAQAVELYYTDVLCLGATTRFMVFPDVSPNDG